MSNRSHLSSSGSGGGGGGSSRPSSTNAWSRPLQQNRTSRGFMGAPPPGMHRSPPGMSSGNNRNSSTTSSRNGPTNGGKSYNYSSNVSSSSSSFSSNGTLSSNSSSNIQIALRERFIHLTLNLVGQAVIVTLTDGSVMEGILHTFTPYQTAQPKNKNVYVFKACKTISGPLQEQEEKHEGEQQVVENGSTVIIAANKVASVHIKSIRLDTNTGGNAASSSVNGSQNSGKSSMFGNRETDAFRTDGDISGRGGPGGGSTAGGMGDLVAAGSAWTSGGGSGDVLGGSLSAPSGGGGGLSVPRSRAEALRGDNTTNRGGNFGASSNNPPATSSSSAGALRGNIGEWDQFRANEQLFSIQATFDENLYTTELDKSAISSTKKEEAERIAREIENTTTSNIHLAEERGHKIEGDFDEEDLYSGVLRSTKTTGEGVSTNKRAEGLLGSNKSSKPAAAAASSTTASTATATAMKQLNEPSSSSTSTTTAKEDENKEKQNPPPSSLSSTEKKKTNITSTEKKPTQKAPTPTPTTSIPQPVRKMNYAAAAAKADAASNAKKPTAAATLAASKPATTLSSFSKQDAVPSKAAATPAVITAKDVATTVSTSQPKEEIKTVEKPATTTTATEKEHEIEDKKADEITASKESDTKNTKEAAEPKEKEGPKDTAAETETKNKEDTPAAVTTTTTTTTKEAPPQKDDTLPTKKEDETNKKEGNDETSTTKPKKKHFLKTQCQRKSIYVQPFCQIIYSRWRFRRWQYFFI